MSCVFNSFNVISRYLKLENLHEIRCHGTITVILITDIWSRSICGAVYRVLLLQPDDLWHFHCISSACAKATA